MRYYNANNVDELKRILKKFKYHYYNQIEKIWVHTTFDPCKRYHDLMKCIKTNPSAENFANVMGNDSWTNINCEDCGEPSHEGIIFNESGDDYERGKFFVCKDCMKKAKKICR